MTVWNGLANRLKQLLGIEQSSVSRLEQAVSGIGGLLGIVAILIVSGPLLHEPAGAVVVASMGASAFAGAGIQRLYRGLTLTGRRPRGMGYLTMTTS